ncbi:MAG: beta-galactosidase trimerization domain-containing protein [Fimbriimonadaceae bacterium]
MAYSFDAAVSSSPNGPSNTTRQHFRANYMDQVLAAYEPFFKRNIDASVIHLAHDELSRYKLVVIPALYLMDEGSAHAVRSYVNHGGTVLMTGYSAKLNGNGQWHDSALPGGLSDVFGLRTAAFYRTDEGVVYCFQNQHVRSSAKYFEQLEPRGAVVLGEITNADARGHFPALTFNTFGEGQAYYLATESTSDALAPVLEWVANAAGVTQGLSTPDGVYARVVDQRVYHVNTTASEAQIPIEGKRRGLLSGQNFRDVLVLPPRHAELLE